MTETVEVHVPRAAIGNELSQALAEHGFTAKLAEDGERCALTVAFATDERDRLATAVARAIESWLADRELPLVVHRSDDGCVVRPPAD